MDETYDVSSGDILFDMYIDMDEYEKDLTSIFNEEQIEKLLSIERILGILTKSEMILFRAYFVENLSYDKIVKKYTFYREKDGKKITYKSKKSIYTLMNGLKLKIKENI